MERGCECANGIESNPFDDNSNESELSHRLDAAWGRAEPSRAARRRSLCAHSLHTAHASPVSVSPLSILSPPFRCTIAPAPLRIGLSIASEASERNGLGAHRDRAAAG